MFFYLKISTKELAILKLFLRTLAKFSNHTFLIKQLSHINKVKRVTVLKSPHVNKLAQEQFEYRMYESNLKISSFHILSDIIKLKQLKEETFAGVKLEIKFFCDRKVTIASNIKNLNPNIMFLDFFKNDMEKSITFITRNIQLFDCEGESCLKNFTVIR